MTVRLRPRWASARQVRPRSDEASTGQVRLRPGGASAGQAKEITRPAALLVTGRVVGLVASFGIGIVLARLFAPATFGTYKQFFLLYGTLYGLAQLGMAESLYYFVPRNAARMPRYVCNALLTLGVAGLACLGALYAWRTQIAGWLTNPGLADYMVLAGLFLTFMLMSTVLEIVMVSRKKHMMAAVTYACSDIIRTLFFIAPALLFVNLRAVFIGATAFAALRVLLVVAAIWRQYGREFRVDLGLWREQLAYALPFALAVGVEVIQQNYHQYVVASMFDAATFAMYAVGCLQIPLVDMIMTSTVNVMMVKMAEDQMHGEATVALWHETICRLAFLMVPLSVFLFVVARELIVALYTATYAASVPIFMVWALTILPSIFAVNAVLRVFAQTRFLLVMNLMRLAMVAVLIGWFLSTFGMSGAVLVTLVSTLLVNLVGVGRIAHLLHLPFSRTLPWTRLGGIFVRAGVAAVPVIWLTRESSLAPVVALGASGAAYAAVYFGLSYFAGLKADSTAPLVPVESGFGGTTEPGLSQT
jgi:O-antigen/teichoic acid export membrane protein